MTYDRYPFEASSQLASPPEIMWINLSKSLVRALLTVEWHIVDDPDEREKCCKQCPACDTYMANHMPACPVDAALTASGLPDQASRDAAREQLQ